MSSPGTPHPRGPAAARPEERAAAQPPTRFVRGNRIGRWLPRSRGSRTPRPAPPVKRRPPPASRRGLAEGAPVLDPARRASGTVPGAWETRLSARGVRFRAMRATVLALAAALGLAVPLPGLASSQHHAKGAATHSGAPTPQRSKSASSSGSHRRHRATASPGRGKSHLRTSPGFVRRVASGKIHRDPAAKAAFRRNHPCPSTGRTTGRCPGYEVDHVRPLACGGADQASNMQWLTAAANQAKGAEGCRRWPSAAPGAFHSAPHQADLPGSCRPSGGHAAGRSNCMGHGTV
jgi:hypothetical protein